MRLQSNIYLIAAAVAIAATLIAGAFGAGLVSGLTTWPSIESMNPFGERETVIDEDRPAVIEKIRSVARLETSVYSIEKVVPARTDHGAITGFFRGDELLLLAHGRVIAGVDLSKLTEHDVDVTRETDVWIMLPESEIFHASLDNEATKVYDRNKGWFTRGDDELESDARRSAEQLIVEAACADDILQRAATDAQAQLERFLTLLEFDEIEIVAPAGECEAHDSDDS